MSSTKIQILDALTYLCRKWNFWIVGYVSKKTFEKVLLFKPIIKATLNRLNSTASVKAGNIFRMTIRYIINMIWQ